MWFLILILSIKLQMPTWYWVIFTILTLTRPFIWKIQKCLEKEIEKSIKELENIK